VVEKAGLDVVEKVSLGIFQKYLVREKIRIFLPKILRDVRSVEGSKEHLLRRFDFFRVVPRVGLRFVV
jgi:hypothetical protein